MKKLILSIFIIAVMFIVRSNVMAFPSSITIDAEGDALTLNSSLNVVNTSAVSDITYPWFHYKSTTTDATVFCTAGNITQPNYGNVCTQKSFDSAGQEKGVAHIINLIYGSANISHSQNAKYWWTEFLVNSYLGKYQYESDSNSYANVYIINSSYTILSTGKTYKTIMSEAKAAAAKTYSNITLSSTELSKFTKGSDGYYTANLTVTSNGNYKVELSNSKFSYTKKGDTYTIKINESDIAIGTTENLTVTISSTETAQTYYVAQNYDCGVNVQSVTLKPESRKTTVASPVTKSGSVTRDKVSIKVAKVNSKGNFIAGAKLLFQTESDKTAGKETKVVTSNSDGYVVIDELSAGKYYLSEKQAPEGYYKSSTVYEIIISSNGVIKLNGNASNGEIRVLNDLKKVTISKTDITGTIELSGAILEIQDKEGNIVKLCTDKDGKKNTECKWVSTGNTYVIEGMPNGTYYLVETLAPKGYVLSEEKVEFKVTDNTINEKVTMKNHMNVVSIKKVDSDSGKLLEGVNLEIQDEEGNIVKLCTDKDGKKNTECKWVSTKEPYKIEGMPVGTYYLVETSTIDRYVLNKKRQKFEIKETTDEKTVTMKNQMNVVKISKLDTTKKQELPGATLQIQDKEGNIVKLCTDKDGKKNTECKWVSTKEPYEIEGMPNGTYYLVETIAPEGYVLSEEKIEFVVDGTEAIVEVEMYNELEVDVPDTSSKKSAMLLTIAMFIVSLGISLIVNAKRNNENEL